MHTTTTTTPTPVSRLVQDPRNVITEDVFRLDPSLLGAPLARPWRRAAAMAVDGMLVAILANAPGMLFGLAAALVLFRASARSSSQSYFRKSIRLMLRFWGAVVLFVVIVTTWDNVGDLGRSWIGGDEPRRTTVRKPSASPAPNLSGLAGLAVAANVIALVRADNEEDARQMAEEMVLDLQKSGMQPGEIREVLTDLRDDPGKPWLTSVADSLLQTLANPAAKEGGVPDSLATQLSMALAAGDTATADRLRQSLAMTLAADTLRELNESLQSARAREQSLEDELERVQRGFGLRSMLGSIADDLGLGFGWTGLYFTAFLALWNGYTPGKRLMRIRVIRLDGKPMGWWYAFERFGGYAASLATGLIGFFQILWDRNRQGIHDKISETVVIESSAR